MNMHITKSSKRREKYVNFDIADYIDNAVALARVKAHITQKELAEAMGVTQAYVSKLENQEKVSPKVLHKVYQALEQLSRKKRK